MNTQKNRTYVLILNCLNGHTQMNELWDANIDLRMGMAERFTLEFYFHFRIFLCPAPAGQVPWSNLKENRKRIFDNLYKTQQAPGTRVSLHVGNVKVWANVSLACQASHGTLKMCTLKQPGLAAVASCFIFAADSTDSVPCTNLKSKHCRLSQLVSPKAVFGWDSMQAGPGPVIMVNSYHLLVASGWVAS